MALNDFLIFYKKPAQWIYAGEDYLTVFKRRGKTVNAVKTFENSSILDMDLKAFGEVRRYLAETDSGLVLNSANFIFNILNFEKIPWKPGVLKELVEWRVNKVFPENIENYIHNYFHLRGRNILSVLFKKSLKEQIETLFRESHIQLVYFGNTTLEIIKNLRRKKSKPDMFIELDSTLCTVVFQHKGFPYYIRKFKSENSDTLLAELAKTHEFVRKTYPLDPQSFSLISGRENNKMIEEKLVSLNLRAVALDQPQRMGLPC
jgi:hypothetical protein